MRRSVRWAGVMVLGFAMTACGGSGSGGNAPPATAALHARLLVASDLGTAWKAGQPINAEDLAAFAQAPCDSATISPTVVKRLTAVTGAQFEPVDRAYRHLIELVATGDVKHLDGDLQTVFAAIESCSNGTSSAAAGSTMTVRKLSIPDLGDQQAAYAVTQKRPGGTDGAMSLRVGYVRMGSVAVALGLADFQASAQGVSQLSDDTFRALLSKATSKLSPAV